jgi:polysaccharide pyruvyl transferase CsaB
MRITISGYYGSGNTGDEAVLAGILESFRVRAAVARESFVILSEDPEGTRALHGVAAEPRMRLSAVRRALRSSDLLISGGGSLVQDVTSLRSAIYYLGVLRLAAMCGTPAMIYAQGVGPLHRRITRVLTRMIVDRTQCVTVRDQASADLLREIGVRRPQIEVVADPAWVLSPISRTDSIGALRQAGVAPDDKVVGISLRPWCRDDPGEDAWLRMIRGIVTRTGARVVFLPMQPPRDTELASRLAALVPGAGIIPVPPAPGAALGLAGMLTGLVAMRLHALVFAAMVGTPMLAIGYDPKVMALMSALGEDAHCVTLAGFEPDAAVTAFVGALDDGEALRDCLKARAAEARERALVAVDLAVSVAGRL